MSRVAWTVLALGAVAAVAACDVLAARLFAPLPARLTNAVLVAAATRGLLHSQGRAWAAFWALVLSGVAVCLAPGYGLAGALLLPATNSFVFGD